VARTICVANQKGGVGKTTTVVNLASAFAKAQRKTLVVDLDPQCNATTAFGLDPYPRHPLVQRDSLRDAIVETRSAGPDVLPGSRTFGDIEALERGEQDAIRHHLSDSVRGYDFVLIDCPPSLGALTEAALTASTEVLMPIQCEYFAMEGLTQMIQVIRRVMQLEANCLEFGGILLTMYDHTLELTREVHAEVCDFFGEIVFDAVIPRDVTVSEAPSHALSVIDYAPRSQGSRAYIELCMEVLDRE